MRWQEVYKWFGDFFTERGFKRKNSILYRKNEYAAFCVFFECTGLGSVYFNYSFYPLIMPCEFFHYSYGGRLIDLCGPKVSTGLKTSLNMPYETEDAIAEWVRLCMDTVDRKLIPLFDKLADPKELRRILHSKHKNNQLRCSNDNRLMLAAYFEVYLCKNKKRTKRFVGLVEDRIRNDPNIHLSEELRTKKIEELMVLKRLIESADGEREAFFERTVAKMSKMFEG